MSDKSIKFYVFYFTCVKFNTRAQVSPFDIIQQLLRVIESRRYND